MPAITPHRDREWRNANQDLMTWLDTDPVPESRVLAALRQWMTTHMSMTDLQTETARALMRDVADLSMARAVGMNPEVVWRVHGYDPAAAGDMTNIFNGTYYVTDNSSDAEYVYQIYTVTRGALNGQRVIKHLDSSGRLQGFATLLRDGRMHIWQRFREFSTESWVEAADMMITHLGNMSYSPEVPLQTSWSTGDLNIRADRSCRGCNGPLFEESSPHSGIDPRCHRELIPLPTFPAESITIAESTVISGGGYPRGTVGWMNPEEDDEDEPAEVTEEEFNVELTCEVATCRDMFSSQELLWHHCRARHPSRYPWMCTECAGTFRLNSDLNMHRVAEHGGRRASTPVPPSRRRSTPRRPAAPARGRVNMSQIDPTWEQ